MEQINVREQDGMSGTDKYKRVGWDGMSWMDKYKRVGWDELDE